MNPTEHIFYLEGNNTIEIGFRHLSTLRKSMKRKETKMTLLHRNSYFCNIYICVKILINLIFDKFINVSKNKFLF